MTLLLILDLGFAWGTTTPPAVTTAGDYGIVVGCTSRMGEQGPTIGGGGVM